MGPTNFRWPTRPKRSKSLDSIQALNFSILTCPNSQWKSNFGLLSLFVICSRRDLQLATACELFGFFIILFESFFLDPHISGPNSRNFWHLIKYRYLIKYCKCRNEILVTRRSFLANVYLVKRSFHEWTIKTKRGQLIATRASRTSSLENQYPNICVSGIIWGRQPHCHTLAHQSHESAHGLYKRSVLKANVLRQTIRQFSSID